jgi:hypothetical protein
VMALRVTESTAETGRTSVSCDDRPSNNCRARGLAVARPRLPTDRKTLVGALARALAGASTHARVMAQSHQTPDDLVQLVRAEGPDGLLVERELGQLLTLHVTLLCGIAAHRGMEQPGTPHGRRAGSMRKKRQTVTAVENKLFSARWLREPTTTPPGEIRTA